MSFLNHFSGADWQNLASTLLHTLWQGAVVALAAALRGTSIKRANLRCLLSLASLAAVLFAGFLTWACLDYREPNTSTSIATPAAKPIDVEVSTTAATPTRMPENEISSATPTDYRNYVIAIWLLGVAVMLARLALALRAADELRRSCRVVTDREVTDLLDRLIAQCFQGEHRVRLLVAEKLSSPVAMGFLWPAIIVPASILGGTSPEMLRAILAHELAHVRRNDYLVNLGQLLVETMLFFNPAVWWISRQVRIEREACCDAEAAALIGDETAYAEALADYVEGRAIPVPALAFGQEKGGGSLADRVRRLLVPGYQPRLRLPLQGLLLFLSIGGLTLALLHQGSRLAVAAGARLLTPKERIAKIREVQATHSHLLDERKWDRKLAAQPGSRVKISARVVDPQGRLLSDDDIWVRARSVRPGYAVSTTLRNDEGIVSAEIEPGIIHLAAESKRHAPALLGPLVGEIAGELKDLKFVMHPGFSAGVKLLNPKGNPITNAVVTGQYEHEAYAALAEHKADGEGQVRFEHLSRHPLALKVKAPGYEHADKVFTFPTNGVLDWRLSSAVVARIKIVNRAGEPIAGAKARLLQIKGPKSMGYGQGSRAVAGVSDADGLLSLDQLREDSSYWFIVEAPGYRRDFLRRVFAGESDRELILGPPIVVSGVIEGDLSQLGEQWQGRGSQRKRVPCFYYSNDIRIDGSNSSYDEPTFVRVEGDRAYFEITNLWPGHISLSVGGQRIRKPLTESITNLRINLAAPATETGSAEPQLLPEREVAFHFVTPPGNPPANGKLLTTLNRKTPTGGFDYERTFVPVTAGRGSLRVPIGSKLDFEPTGFTGYWFPSPRQTEITNGPGPQVFPINCFPAGAIYGTLTEENGSPAKAMMISLVEVEKAKTREFGNLDVEIKSGASSGDLTERFTATPLPLGGTYMIVAHRGAHYVTSEALPITPENPVRKVKLVMRKGRDIRGRLLNPDGTPAVGIKYSLSFVPRVGSHSFGTSDQYTDRRGRFTIRDTNPSVDGSHRLWVNENPGYQKQPFPLDGVATNVDFELKPGRVVTGRVIDGKSGWPIPGARVFALPRPHGSNRTGFLDADAPTDERGQFRFSTMDDGQYAINVGGGVESFGDGRLVRGGQTEQLVLPVKLLPHSKLKPADPNVKQP